MAYNYYQPMGYTPMYNQYNNQIPNPQPQIQPQIQAQNTIIWVTYDEMLVYPIAPNTAVALWDKNNSTIYIKRADSTGKPSVQILDYTERREQSPKRQTEEVPKYVTVEAFDKLSKTVDGIIEKMKEDREDG